MRGTAIFFINQKAKVVVGQIAKARRNINTDSAGETGQNFVLKYHLPLNPEIHFFPLR